MVEKLKQYRWIIATAVVILALTFVFFSPRITLQRRLLVSGKHNLEIRNYSEAAADFERVVHYVPRSPLGLEAARLGGGVCLYGIWELLK